MTDDYITRYSDQQYLKRIEIKGGFEKRNITLTKLSDFFIHIVVPSRSNVILEEIDFVDELHVKAIAMTSRGPGVLYYLEKQEDSWWITIF